MADIYSEIGNYCVGSSLGWQNLSPTVNIDIIRFPTLRANHSGVLLESLPHSFQPVLDICDSLFLLRTLHSDVLFRCVVAFAVFNTTVFYVVCRSKDLGISSSYT